MTTIRLALAQINTTVGDLEANKTKILQAIQRARELGADLVALPEMAVSGYPPEDLLLKPSFVEANQVDLGQSFPELLHADVGDRGRVYSIGVSGAQLSQYLVFADYAKTRFRPDAMAIVIISNDFDESLRKYQSAPRFHYFNERDGELVLERIDYRPSKLKRLLRKSAFVLVECLLNLFFRQYVREGQARSLHHGRKYQPKSLWKKSASLIK